MSKALVNRYAVGKLNDKIKKLFLFVPPLFCLFCITAASAQELKSETLVAGEFQWHVVTASMEAAKDLPTVIFEAGMGEDAATWDKLQPIVAKSTRAVAYDRAGLGKSKPASQSPRTAKQMALELHVLLQTAKIPPPYILVGHSLGGWIAGVYAHLYPEEVAGIVLVDPAYRESRLQARISAEDWARREKTILQYSGEMTETQRLEKNSLELSGEQAEKYFPLRKIPVFLLSGMKINRSFPGAVLEREVKLEAHKKWLTKMPGAEHILVENSRHYIHLEQPAEVICAINHIIKSISKK
ncbi:MAG: alpha/beta hydrolase [Acidobacteriota bacterium]|nr:alpha/beta hydrolase [Acidobacteriota bacterium]